MLNIFFGGVEQAQQTICDSLSFPGVEQALFPWSGLPHSWGMDFWGVCGEEETEDSLCCRELLLVFSAWCWEFSPAF